MRTMIQYWGAEATEHDVRYAGNDTFVQEVVERLAVHGEADEDLFYGILTEYGRRASEILPIAEAFGIDVKGLAEEAGSSIVQKAVRRHISIMLEHVGGRPTANDHRNIRTIMRWAEDHGYYDLLMLKPN